MCVRQPGARRRGCVYDGKLIFAKGTLADVEHDARTRPPRPSTRVGLEAVHGFAIAARAAGKLSIDDDVRKHIPDCTTSARRSRCATCSPTRAACGPVDLVDERSSHGDVIRSRPDDPDGQPA